MEGTTRAVLLAVLALAAARPADAQGGAAPATPQRDQALWQRSLDELMQVEVISVGKKEQRVFDSAASVYVITRDDIRRSGLTSVPELLRLAPGVTVARLDGSKWAVSVRGFTSRFATKLLVMVDGRSLYNRMFSGVFWDALDTPVQEIERIEVIRGPGGSIWGANAVNGVVNIVTRAAAASEGTALTTGASSAEGWWAGTEHSRAIGRGALRVFARAADRRDDPAAGADVEAGRQAVAGLRYRRGGLGRPDFQLSASGAHIEAGQQTSIFHGVDAPAPTVERVAATTDSGSLVARWIRPSHGRGEWQLTGSFDGMRRQEPGLFRYLRVTAEGQVQHRIRAGRRNDVVWGAGWRHSRDDGEVDGATLSIDAPWTPESLFNAFVQDEVRVTRDLRLSAGAKVEHVAVAGWNVQPTARFWWSADQGTAVWAAVSRAARTPSRIEMTVEYNAGSIPEPGPVPVLTGFVGNPDAQPELVTAYEAGIRSTVHERVALDVSAFFNRYDRLLATELRPPRLVLTPYPHMLAFATPVNALSADTTGVEAAVTGALTPAWQLTGTAAAFRLVRWDGASPDVTAESVVAQTPGLQWSIRSRYARRPYDLDVSLMRVSSVRRPFVPAYARLDAHISRRLSADVALAVTGQNLLQARHVESSAADLLAVIVPVRRSVSIDLVWRLKRR
jgi:iron complex outermembrane receptor protein